MIMDSSKNGRWIMPFKKFSRLWVKDIDWKVEVNVIFSKTVFNDEIKCLQELFIS